MKIIVETGARLHFGFYILHPVRRLWGSIGLAIQEPGYKIVLEEAGSIEVAGCQRARIFNILREAMEKLRIDTPIRVEARECIPEHRGFGSTTQLKLAIYSGLARLAGIEADVYKLAKLAGRGKISGVGIAVFAYGGFIVDSGKRLGSDDVPKPIIRFDFPENWRIVYITPLTRWRVPEEGERVFQGSIGYEKQCELYDTVFGWLIPSLAEGDFEEFTAALSKLQRMMGEYFSRAQAGLYCCKESALAAKALEEAGARGVGQSSWGPTVYGFARSESEARDILNRALARLEEQGVRIEVYGITSARNRGAVVSAS